MAEGIITQINSDGTITIPRELMEKFNLKDRVEIVETHCSKGILIKALIES
jgi:bifunctional DNA-binding transcriptional regulator/antitoxin component of YhaV-PrlF toxin-antitoxin module